MERNWVSWGAIERLRTRGSAFGEELAVSWGAIERLRTGGVTREPLFVAACAWSPALHEDVRPHRRPGGTFASRWDEYDRPVRPVSVRASRCRQFQGAVLCGIGEGRMGAGSLQERGRVFLSRPSGNPRVMGGTAASDGGLCGRTEPAAVAGKGVLSCGKARLHRGVRRPRPRRPAPLPAARADRVLSASGGFCV